MIYSIDFGTSNSLLGAADHHQTYLPIDLDPSAKSPRVMRSVIYFENSSSSAAGPTPGRASGLTFGHQAIARYLENSMSGRLIRSFKRFLPNPDFQGTRIGSKLWTLEELIAAFLRHLRERANTHFQMDVQQVVLGRPALFSEDPGCDQLAQQRLHQAAELAGFKSIEFLPEPVAAAYRYRFEMQKPEIVLIADFGGGTSDYTLIQLSQTAAFQPTDVLAIGGVPLAGDALDGSIMRYRVSENFGSQVQYRVPFGSNVLTMPTHLMASLCSTAHIQLLLSRDNAEFFRQLRTWSIGADDRKKLDQLKVLLEDQLGFSVFEAIESAKVELSQLQESQVSFNYPGVSIQDRITQEELVNYTQNEITRIMGALDETLKQAGIRPDQVDRVCCTGGSAQSFLIRRELERRFSPSKLDHFNHFSSIVEGLSERAHQIACS